MKKSHSSYNISSQGPSDLDASESWISANVQEAGVQRQTKDDSFINDEDSIQSTESSVSSFKVLIPTEHYRAIRDEQRRRRQLSSYNVKTSQPSQKSLKKLKKAQLIELNK